MEKEGTEVVAGQAASIGFTGAFEHSLDGKRRLIIPSAWRQKIADPALFVFPGVDSKCLYAITAEDMRIKLERFRSVSVADAAAQQFARTFFSKAAEIPLDGQGRIRITDPLLDFAEIEGQVVLAGVGNRFELWRPETWRSYQASLDQKSFAEAARYIGF